MTIDQLGTIRGQFRPSIINLFAGVILGLLAIVGGCALLYICTNGVAQSSGNLPFWTAKGQKGWSWGAVGIMSVIGMALIPGGAFLIWWMQSLLSYRVQVGQHGLAVTSNKRTSVIGWDDILQITEIHVYERPPIAAGIAKLALPKVLSRNFVVKTNRGEAYPFDRNTVKSLDRLYDLVKTEAVARKISWDTVEVQC